MFLILAVINSGGLILCAEVVVLVWAGLGSVVCGFLFSPFWVSVGAYGGEMFWARRC